MSWRWLFTVVIQSTLFYMAQTAYADELRPSYIELSQTSIGQWSLTWKASERSNLGQNGAVILPENCSSVEGFKTRRENDNLIRTALIKCQGGLEGQSIGLQGLEKSSTDALVRIKPLTSDTLALRLTPKKNIAIMPTAEQGISNNVLATYSGLGVEHILLGYDHLLFVLSLVLLLSGWKRIAWAITAFTIAHSITLVGTTLGIFSLPQKPVEAVIALSIVFLALEIIKSKPNQMRLSENNPWAVAFIFGLLHGFGFAGALAEIGLPTSELPLALLGFNLGVEIGQLLIVAIALLTLNRLQKTWPHQIRHAKTLLAYLIGTIATYWLIDRLLN